LFTYEEQVRPGLPLENYFTHLCRANVKGMGSICFSQKWIEKKNCRKNYKYNFKSNNYEICTAAAGCVPNSLDVMVLENINLSSDRNRATLSWSNDKDLDFCQHLVIYAIKVYISTSH
jgi:hypothetical protein